MEKKTKKAKLEFFNFFRKSAESQGIIAFDKIGGNCALSVNSTKIHLLGYFACRNHIYDENSAKSYGFHEQRKKSIKLIHFGNF